MPPLPWQSAELWPGLRDLATRPLPGIASPGPAQPAENTGSIPPGTKPVQGNQHRCQWRWGTKARSSYCPRTKGINVTHSVSLMGSFAMEDLQAPNPGQCSSFSWVNILFCGSGDPILALETTGIRENGAISPPFVSVWPALNSTGKSAGELMERFGFLHWFSPLKTKEEISGIFIVYIFQECAVPLWARKTMLFRLLMLDGVEVFRSSSLRVLEHSLRWQECWATEFLSHVEAVPGGG